jgi:hypothetical protein
MMKAEGRRQRAEVGTDYDRSSFILHPSSFKRIEA